MQEELRRADHLTRKHRAEVRNGVGEPAPEFVSIDEIDQHGNVKERDVSEIVSELQEAGILWRTVATLPERQRQLIVGLLEERKQRDIATEIGVTERRLCQLKVSAFSTLRVRLNKQGIHR